jgi:antirestriction protein ArdC
MTERAKRPNLREQLVEELLARIATNTAPWQQPWSPGMGDPVNAVTGKRYRGVNYWALLLAQPDSDPRWCTFLQAKNQGWSVRKGAHGVQVEKWGVTEPKPDAADEDKQVQHIYVRYYWVFHASQIEGIPKLEESTPCGPVLEHDQRLLTAIRRMGVQLVHKQSAAYYVPTADQIVLPPPSAFATASDYDMTLLHEMSHATGHKSRMDRPMNNRFASPAYAREELMASISSAMNARILGIAMDPSAIHEGDRDSLENEAAYVSSWLQALPKAARNTELLGAIAAAQKISDYVVALTLPQQEEVTEAAEEHEPASFRTKIHL